MKPLAFCLVTALLLSSCHFLEGRKIHGNGHVISQERSASSFNSVEVSSAIRLFVKQDSAVSIKVETDENLQQYVRVGVENGVLRVHQENNTSLDATGEIKVYVSAPQFHKVEASGACNVSGENQLTGDEMEIEVSGASEIKLDVKAPRISVKASGASTADVKGETKDLLIDADGASHARCGDLRSENASVDISGATSADVNASVKLVAEASGASEIRYRGAANVSQRVTGASSVKKVD